jgi:hypothetical protein
MALTTILLKPDELTRNTIMGGNIDVDRYLPMIKIAQNTMIKPLLGKTLYDKICLDFENDDLAGDYLEMYEDYIKEMVIHSSSEIYLSQGAYMVSNNGISKMKSDSNESVSKEEVDYLVQSARKIYNHYERQFLAWIKDKDVVEYPKEDTNRHSNRINVGGWSLKRKGC